MHLTDMTFNTWPVFDRTSIVHTNRLEQYFSFGSVFQQVCNRWVRQWLDLKSFAPVTFMNHFLYQPSQSWYPISIPNIRHRVTNSPVQRFLVGVCHEFLAEETCIGQIYRELALDSTATLKHAFFVRL